MERPTLAPRIHWQDVEGEIVILDASGLHYLGLNDSGAVLWRALAGGSSASALVGVLETSCDIDAATAERDVKAFLDDLTTRGLIVFDA